MEEPILNLNAQVTLSEGSLLHLIVSTPCRAEFQLNGFFRPVVKMIDYRLSSARAILPTLARGRDDEFARQFSLPARVSLYVAYQREIRIELRDPVSPIRSYLLWICSGPKEPLSFYPEIFRHSSQVGEGRFVAFSICRSYATEENRVRALTIAV